MVMSLLYTLWGWIKANLRLKKCLVMEADEGQITFQYKGKTYLRDKFVLLTAQSIADLKKGQIEQLISDMERNLPKSKNPDYDQALLDAYTVAYQKQCNKKSTFAEIMEQWNKTE